jgi:hypothetical protein
MAKNKKMIMMPTRATGIQENDGCSHAFSYKGV